MVIRAKQLLLGGSALILCAAAGIGLWLCLKPTEEKRIRARFREFSAACAKQPRESAVTALGKAKTISNLFADSSSFVVAGLPWAAGPYARDDLCANAFRARALFGQMNLTFSSLTLEIDAARGRAKATFSAVLKGELNSGGRIREVRELECNLVKPRSTWLFKEFRGRKLINK